MRTAHWYDCTSREASAEDNQALMKAAMMAQFAAEPFEARMDAVVYHLERAVQEINRIRQDALDDGDEERADASHVAERIIYTVTRAVANAQLAYLVTPAATLDRAARAVAELIGPEKDGIPWSDDLALRLSILVALAALVLLCCVGCSTSTPDRRDALERRDIVSTAVAATLTAVAEATPTPRGFVLEPATPDNTEIAQRTAYAKQAPHPYPTSASRWVHIDGTVEDGSILPGINIWSNYQTRSWLCRLPHGTRVQMVRRVGDGVEIICPSGKKGWVTYWFIKELK